MRPKLAIVRGHFFSKDETLMFEPLKDEFDITFFASTGNHDHGDVSFPVIELPCLDKKLNSLSFSAFGKICGLIGNMTGVDMEFIFGLKKTLCGFDIVHTIDYSYLVTYQLARLKDKLGFKLVATHWDNIPFARDGKRLCKAMKYKIYEKVDGFFAMSERAKASLILEGVDESKIFVVGWGVDTNKFKPDDEAGRTWRRRYGIDDEEVVILFVGRVRASKGIFELIYATKKLVDDPGLSNKRIRVVIAGRGPREKDVAKMIMRLGLNKKFLQIGYIPHGEIHNAHNMADIFCLPSVPRKYWQEQLGMVFLEAMACGKPVVSTLSGSIPEIVGDAGILVQPNDHVALYEGLRRLIKDPILRNGLGEKGLIRVLSKFSVDKIGNTTMTCYKRLRSQNGN